MERSAVALPPATPDRLPCGQRPRPGIRPSSSVCLPAVPSAPFPRPRRRRVRPPPLSIVGPPRDHHRHPAEERRDRCPQTPPLRPGQTMAWPGHPLRQTRHHLPRCRRPQRLHHLVTSIGSTRRSDRVRTRPLAPFHGVRVPGSLTDPQYQAGECSRISRTPRPRRRRRRARNVTLSA